jgi:Pyridoxamine 5'-phosphate oxidase
LRWGGFAEVRPDLARAGRELIYQYGVGLAFLATVRSDGGPRLHPMCPLITDDDLLAFIVPSPKRADLHRDPRFAMHSFPADENEDAFLVRGVAEQVDDATRFDVLTRQFAAERRLEAPPPEAVRWELFAFDISMALLTRTTGHGDPAPRHQVWRETEPGAARGA